MKNIISSVLFFYCIASFAQKDRLYLLSLSFIEKSESGNDIAKLRSLLNDRPILSQRIFDQIPSINPLNPSNKNPITSTFGKRFHPIDNRMKLHHGIDIGAPAGTPVHVSANGKVTLAQRSDIGYGNIVVVQHGFGFETIYAHLYTFLVKTGQTLKKGDIIGFVGSTGKSTGNHIHYEVKKNGQQLDPISFISLEN